MKEYSLTLYAEPDAMLVIRARDQESAESFVMALFGWDELSAFGSVTEL